MNKYYIALLIVSFIIGFFGNILSEYFIKLFEHRIGSEKAKRKTMINVKSSTKQQQKLKKQKAKSKRDY